MSNNKNPSNFFEKITAEVDKEVQELKVNLIDVSKSEIPSPKFVKKWSKTYDDSMLLDKSLNAFAGEVRLSIPLVDVQVVPSVAIIYDLTFDAQSKAFKNQFLGDFISVDHQNSVFHEAFIYHLNLRGFKSQLKRTSIENEFSLDASDAKISFDPLKQQWIIENSSDRVVYGNSAGNGAVKHGLTFQNWSGSGSESTDLKEIPLTWYIAERHSKSFGTSVFYKYQVTEEKFITSYTTEPYNSYTSKILLKEVSTSNGEVSIKFGYENARSTEQNDEFVDEEGMLMLNNLMVNDQNLISVFVDTREYEQRFELQWNEKKLSKFTQNGKNLLELSYNNENLLSEVKTVHGTVTNYAYDTQEMKFLNVVKNFPVRDIPSIGSCGDFMIFATKLPFAIDVEIVDSTTMLVTQKVRVPASITGDSTIEIRSFGRDFLIAYKIYSHSIVSVFTYDTDKAIFDKSMESLYFQADADIQFTSNYVAVHEGSSVKILQEVNGEWITQQFNFQNAVKIHANNHFVAVHEGQNLHLMHKKGDKWTQKLLKSGFVGNSANILNKFDITTELREKLLAHSSQFHEGFQTEGNVIVWSTIEENSGRFYKILEVIMLDTNLDIAKAMREKFKSYREDIFDLKEVSTDENTGIEYTLGYIQTSNNKYRVGIKSMCCDAEIAKAIGSSNRNRIADFKTDQIEASEKDDSEMAKNLRKSFLSQSDAKYRVVLTSTGIYLGDDDVFEFDGAEWSQNHLQEQRVVELSENFELKFDTSDKNSIKLIDKKENFTHDLSIFESSSFVNKFPLYIAYQPSESTTTVIFFDKGTKIISQKTFNDESLLASSNYRQIMTIKKSTWSSSDRFEVIMRATASFMPKVFFPVVTQEQRTSKDEVRLRKFERAFTTTSQKLTTIPSSSKANHGWLEQTLTKETQEMKFFDADGKIEKLEVKKNEDGEEEDFRKTYADSLLYDVSKTLQISNFVPYKMSYDEIAFYGFEKYETSENWKFDARNLIKHETSLTGRTFLRLNSLESTVTRSFTPKNQKDIFIATAWIRAPTESNESTPFFKAVMSVDGEELFGLFGHVISKVGEWSRVAVEIDLVETVKKIFDEKRALNTNEVGDYREPIFTIKLVASGNANSPIDVDSIAFHPIGHRLEVNVYNDAGKVVSMLNADNSISKLFYNPINGKNFARTKNDEIEHFTVTGENAMLKMTPQSGFHETFEVLSRWTISNHENFSLSNGKLHHNGASSSIKSKNNSIDEESAAVRFEYAIDSNSSIDFSFLDFKISLNDKHLVINGKVKAEIPSHGEILILKHEKRLAVWIDGNSMPYPEVPQHKIQPFLDFSRVKRSRLEQLTSLKNSWKSFEISCSGKTLIRDFFILNRPLVELRFFNNWNDERQIIKLESDVAAIVTEKIYDELGRELLITKPTKISSSEPLLIYQNNFIKSFNPQNGMIEGLVSALNPNDEGFPYSQTVYHKDLLGERKIQGLPGKDFSASGKFSVKYEKTTQIPFIKAFFPSSHGFRHRVEKLSNGSTRVLVFNTNEKKVAKYVEVPGFEHSLSTYEYDDELRIVKVLPPSYHEAVKTFEAIDSIYQSGISQLNSEEMTLQSKLCTHFKYDERGNIIEKKTPDEGVFNLFYNSNDQLKFTKSSDGKIIFYNYNRLGLLTVTGLLDESFSNEILQKLVDADSFVSANPFQQILFNVEEDTKLIATTNHNELILEQLKFDKNEQITSQTTKIVSQAVSTETFYEVKRKFTGDKVKVLTYPAANESVLKLLHTYNNLGQLVSLGTSKNPTAFASFTYNANNQIESEKHSANKIDRKFEYNSPGFLQAISDQHLTEKISYIEGGYGQQGYGDGIVMKTTFDAAWSENIEHEFDHSELNESCIDFLLDADYIDDNNRFKKLFKSHVEVKTPINCKEKKIFDELSAKFQVPSHYGHRYAYGTHRELVKSKYFSDEEEAQSDPLQPDIFSSKIDGVSKEMSDEIWKVMNENNFISVDQRRDDWKTGFGSRGMESMVRDEEIEKELEVLNDAKLFKIDFEIFFSSIKRLIFHAIEMNKRITLDDFKESFLSWNEATHGVTRIQQAVFIKSAEKLYENLTAKKLLPAITDDLKDSLSTNLRSSLKKYKNHLLNIVKVTSIAFNHDLLTTSFDTSSHEIDANGNHKKFFTGFAQVDISYEENSNRIDSLKINRFGDSKGQKVLKINHDVHGNVLNAPHHGVDRFTYHPVSQRVTDVQMTDGRTIKFHYNGQGERILKQVFTVKGEIEKETFYIRDGQGNVLMDKVTTFKDNSSVEVTTHYIYGPRGLIGFLRNDTFHSVFTDHAGSVRLVIKNGAVVAAYDYLPYGELMRKIVTDESAEISYKFNGKELDDEMQTYNFHARFYDPLLGRFLQIDPESQYFSPYKFSGNSPISFVDPDGEFGFILAFGLAFAGAYLGGAAANDRWLFWKWDWQDHSTYLGMTAGGITGFLAPLGAAASIAVVGKIGTAASGVVVAYFFASASASSFDPKEWKWESPKLYFELFNGAVMGAGIIGNVASIHDISSKLNGISKAAFLSYSYGSAAACVYGGISMENDNWNIFTWEKDYFSNPKTYKAMITGFDFGVTLPVHLVIVYKTGKSFITSLSFSCSLPDLSHARVKALLNGLRDPQHPFYKVAGVTLLTYLAASEENKDFNPANWKNTYATYQAAFIGMMRGIQTLILIDYVKIKNPHLKSNRGVRDTSVLDVDFESIPILKQHSDNLPSNKQNYSPRKCNSCTNFFVAVNVDGEKSNRILHEKIIDKELDFFEKCPRQEEREASHCVLLPDRANIHEHLLENEFLFDEDKFLETRPIMIENPTSFDTIDGVFMKDLESNGLKLVADPTKTKTFKFNRIKLDLKRFIPYDGSEKIPIVTDGSEDVSIYFKELTQQGVRGIEIFLHKDDETMRKIHLNNSKLNRKDFLENLTQLSLNNRKIYFDSDGKPISELAHLEDSTQLELYDMKNRRLEIMRGAVRIPSDGIKYRGKDGSMQELKTINEEKVLEIQSKNLEIQKAKRDFSSKYDYVVRWEDLNSLDDNYKIINQFSPSRHPITIQLSSGLNRWRVISHSLHDNSPRIVDTPFGKPSSSPRNRRSVESSLIVSLDGDFVSDSLKITSDSAWSKPQSQPSILELGDSWLNSTDISSNLMLAYVFMKRWSNEKFNFNSTHSDMAMTSTECELFASNAVHDFSENLIKISLNCGIPTVMREVLNDLEMHKILQKVKGKCERNSIDSIGRTLIGEIVEKNKWKIITRSSEKQFEKVRSKIGHYSLELTNNLKKTDDARWIRASKIN